MNRYYDVTISGPANRWLDIRDRLGPATGKRERPHQLVHWMTSPDGTHNLIQAFTDDAEHAYLVSLAWVKYVGYLDETTRRVSPEVSAYLQANAAIWG